MGGWCDGLAYGLISGIARKKRFNSLCGYSTRQMIELLRDLLTFDLDTLEAIPEYTRGDTFVYLFLQLFDGLSGGVLCINETHKRLKCTFVFKNSNISYSIKALRFVRTFHFGTEIIIQN